MKDFEYTNDNFTINIKNSNIYITGEITDDMSHVLIMKLNEIRNELSSKTSKKINLYLTTCGGGLSNSLYIYDYFNMMKNEGIEITCYIGGYSYSGGTIIMCGANKVFMNRNGEIMLHEYWGWLGYQKHSDIESKSDRGKKLMKKMIDVYNKKIKQKKKKINKSMLEKDWYMDYNEALEWGLIDGFFG